MHGRAHKTAKHGMGSLHSERTIIISLENVLISHAYMHACPK